MKRTLLGDIGLRILGQAVTCDDPAMRRRAPVPASGTVLLDGVEYNVTKVTQAEFAVIHT